MTRKAGDLEGGCASAPPVTASHESRAVHRCRLPGRAIARPCRCALGATWALGRQTRQNLMQYQCKHLHCVYSVRAWSWCVCVRVSAKRVRKVCAMIYTCKACACTGDRVPMGKDWKFEARDLGARFGK
jgi:hypothetical protein